MLAPKATTDRKPEKDVHIREAEKNLRLKLGTRVNIVRSRRGGRIEIQFASEEELQRLYEELSRGGDSLWLRWKRTLQGLPLLYREWYKFLFALPQTTPVIWLSPLEIPWSSW